MQQVMNVSIVHCINIKMKVVRHLVHHVQMEQLLEYKGQFLQMFAIVS